MADPFVAEIRMLPYTFAPKGWATCDGQLIPLSQNTALFSLLGTYYGGNGKSNFALPNLMGSAPMGVGQSPGGSEHYLGEQGGSATVTLIDTEIPSHSHAVRASNERGDNSVPGPSVVLSGSAGGSVYSQGATVGPTLDPNTVSPAGGSAPHNNMQPYLTLQFCIAMQGVFPPRQ
jgi:microcystin-dependent protein